MDGGMLSQEEINALMGGGDNSDSASASAKGTSERLTDAERDAVGEIANINMGTAATTLSTLLNNKVVITTPRVSYVSINELSQQYDRPCVFIHISIGNIFEEPLKDIIERGLRIKWFNEYQPLCLSGEHRNFIKKYMSEFYGKPLPISYKEAFTAEDFVDGIAR